MRSSGLRGRFVGAREAASSIHALVCPPQAPLRADPLLSCGPRNRQRTAAGQRAGSAPEQGMWLAGATSFRRALGPWGPGERARRRRRRARRRRRSARSAALSGHLRSRNGLRSGCTPGMEGTSKTLKSLFFDGVTGRSPGAKNARLLPLPAIRLPVESCGQAHGRARPGAPAVHRASSKSRQWRSAKSNRSWL